MDKLFARLVVEKINFQKTVAMKNLILVVCTILLFYSCNKEQLSDDLSLGEVELLIDGKLETSFKSDIRYDTLFNTVWHGFTRVFDYNIETVSFSDILPKHQIYEFSVDRVDAAINFRNTQPHYSLSYDGDQSGDSYEPFDLETGFFEIVEIDKINQTIKGEFRAKFKRTERSSFGNERGRRITIEGKFYDQYTFE